MGDIYTAQLQFDHVGGSPPPVSDGMGGAQGLVAAVLLMASDGNTGARSRWAVWGGVAPSAYAGGTIVEWRAFYAAAFQSFSVPVDGPDPFSWSSPLAYTGFQEADGRNGAGYFNGGTLSVVKDFDGDLLTFETPLGNIVTVLSSTNGGIALNPSPLYPFGIGQQIGIAANTVAYSETSQLFDFYMLKNGATVFGHALSTSDPGLFGPWQASLGLPSNNAQLGTRLRLEIDVGIAQTSPFAADDQWTTSAEFPPWRLETDMDQAPDHGVIWRAGPSGFDGGSVWVERTFDGARSWQLSVAFTDSTTNNTSPSINWFAGRLYLVWHDGTNIRQTVSLDGGFTWPVPITFPYSGTNPRHVIDKQGGVGLYFFIQSGADLYVARSFDGGNSFVDVSPQLVVAGIGAQQIDADFAPDGSAVVTYFHIGIWNQLRSRDLGKTWS